MKTWVIGLVVLSATLAQGVVPRFGTTFDRRLAVNELGTVTQIGATALPVTAFVDDGHGGWALNGAAFPEKSVALYADGKGGGWNATLTGNTNVTMVVDGEPKTVLGTEIASDWVLSLRAKVGDADDQILWYLRYGNAGVGVYLRTVSNNDGGLDLSLEWTLHKDNPPYVNIIFENVDTTDFHHYVIVCSQSDGLRLFVDGEQKWQAASITAYTNPEGTATQSRTPYSKGYSALWLGCVKGKSNVGTGAWTTVYDDVRFYSTNNASDSSVPTTEEIIALTETVQEDRVLVLPNARLSISFDDRTLKDAAGVIDQVGADVPAKSAFCLNNRGGYTLDAARLEDGMGACLYQFGNTWADYQPLFDCDRETGRSFAISLVAKIAPVDGAAVCYVHYGNTGVGLVLYTVRNATGGTDLALAWLGSSSHIAYPNVVAANIDTMDYHHYVLTCSADSEEKNARPIRLWIDASPVDLFTEKKLSYYTDEAATTTATRMVANKGYSGLYLAAARGATKACTAPNGTRFGDVRLFVGEEATDGYGSSAISPENIEALYRKLMPYADRVPGGLIVSFR